MGCGGECDRRRTIAAATVEGGTASLRWGGAGDADLALANGSAQLFEALGRIDGATIPGEWEAVQTPSWDESREHVAREVGGHVCGEDFEEFGREDGEAGVGPWSGGEILPLLVGRSFEEADDAAVRVDGHGAVGVGALVEEQGGQGLLLAMEPDQGGEVLVGQDVAVLDEERLGGVEEGAEVADGSGRAEQDRLEGIVQLNAPGSAGAEVVAEEIVAEVEVEGDLVEAVRGGMLDEVFEEGSACDLEQGFGGFAGEAAESGAVAGAEDEGLHGAS